MIKVSDYITKRIVEFGVKDVFMISGGGAMHLVDSVGRQRGLKYICTHHEQAAAMAAEGYSRVSGKIGVVVVTSGPGSTNTITGVIGQWLDSVPCLYISGQVKQETTIESCRGLGLRQLGDQEINIIDIVRPVTKFVAIVTDPKKVRFLLEKAMHIATHGRPGPVWLDITLNVQAAMIDENSLAGFDEKEIKPELNTNDIKTKIKLFVEKLKKSERPVIIVGNGIRISGQKELFYKIANRLGIPLLQTFNGFDMVPTDHKLAVGRIGTIGDRAGNFALQNADLVISLGSRNNIRQVSYNWGNFAKAAYKISVDIDYAELKKPIFKPDLPINVDLAYFLKEFNKYIAGEKFPDWSKWLNWCIDRKKKYPVVLPEYEKNKKLVQPYYFVQKLTECLSEKDIVVAGNGSACVSLFQAGVVKKGQRMFWNSGCASMGYDLPASIGACFANNKNRVICLAGDGSLQMNIQELQTVVYHRLPIKLFVLNNQGYISIKQTQDSFFEGRYIACDRNSGVSFPDITKVASAYGLPMGVIESHYNIKQKIIKILNTKGPYVCDVRLLKDYKFSPKLSSERLPDGRMISKPLEDMYPFLEREEFKKNMIVDFVH